jgi:uncharacterized sulfatase
MTHPYSKPRAFATRIAALLVVLLLAPLSFAQDKPKPNVLFIAVDDLNMHVGAYGYANAKTPNIDRLAARGVRFERAYCQYPFCNPSRASMLTGMRPDTLMVYDLQTNLRLTQPNCVTLPQLFKNNGYFSGRVGKIYHYGVPREIGTPGMDDPQSWNYTYNPRGKDKDDEAQIKILTRGTGSKTIGFAMAWMAMEGTDEEQTDGKGATECIRLLEEHKDKPFFIGMGFYRPHTPFVAPKKWFDQHPLSEIKLPEVLKEEKALIPDIARMIFPPNYGLAVSDLVDCVRAYDSAVSFMDAQVGRVLDKLDELKLTDNTIIVFFSDHGFLLGEHEQWQKQMVFDRTCQVPMIISVPGIKPSVVAHPVELLDVYPTIAEAAGLEAPKNLEGKSLMPLLKDPKSEWNKPAFSQVTRNRNKPPVMGYSIRTERYRYTMWGKDASIGQELYDYQTDPDEHHNIAGEKDSESIIAQLRPQVEAYAKNWTVKPPPGKKRVGD